MATINDNLKTTAPVAGSTAGGAAATTGNTSGIATPSMSQSYNDYSADTINKIYDAQKEAAVGQLNNSFNANLREAEASRDRIGGVYQDTMNQLTNEYERTRKNTNEQIAASGMNTGAGSQVGLAQRSEYQRDFGKLGKAEDEAVATAERGITTMRDKYAADMNSILQNNDYERATALLAQYKEDYNRKLAEADKRAALGDFSGYETIFGKDEADRMQTTWYAQNPDLAYMTGNITSGQRNNIKNGRPINYGLDENGNPIVSSGGGGGSDWDAVVASWYSGGGGKTYTANVTTPGGANYVAKGSTPQAAQAAANKAVSTMNSANNSIWYRNS